MHEFWCQFEEEANKFGPLLVVGGGGVKICMKFCANLGSGQTNLDPSWWLGRG